MECWRLAVGRAYPQTRATRKTVDRHPRLCAIDVLKVKKFLCLKQIGRSGGHDRDVGVDLFADHILDRH